MTIKPSDITVIDLFAGCGGMSLGFKNLGFNLVAAYDFWKPALDIYDKNFEHPVFDVDIAKLDSFKIFKEFNPSMFIAGSPCQDFSIAGKKNEDLGRGDLTPLFAEIVADLKPQWFILENVERIEKSHKYQLYRNILKNAGYGLTELKLDASLCGVPQKRKRFFCLGELGGVDNQFKYFLNKNLSKKPLTLREFFGESLGVEHYYRHPRTYGRRAVFSIDEPSPTIRGVNRPIPSTYKAHPGDTALISEGVRPLTTLERSYIQTFPKNFVFEGSKTNLEQMIGNAVPVKMAEYIGNCFLEYLNSTNISIESKSMQI